MLSVFWTSGVAILQILHLRIQSKILFKKKKKTKQVVVRGEGTVEDWGSIIDNQICQWQYC